MPTGSALAGVLEHLAGYPRQVVHAAPGLEVGAQPACLAAVLHQLLDYGAGLGKAGVARAPAQAREVGPYRLEWIVVEPWDVAALSSAGCRPRAA